MSRIYFPVYQKLILIYLILYKNGGKIGVDENLFIQFKPEKNFFTSIPDKNIPNLYLQDFFKQKLWFVTRILQNLPML